MKLKCDNCGLRALERIGKNSETGEIILECQQCGAIANEIGILFEGDEVITVDLYKKQ